jgi:hypothetical protein
LGGQLPRGVASEKLWPSEPSGGVRGGKESGCGHRRVEAEFLDWPKRSTWRILSCGAFCLTGRLAFRPRLARALVGERFRRAAGRVPSVGAARNAWGKSGVACQRRPDRFRKGTVLTLAGAGVSTRAEAAADGRRGGAELRASLRARAAVQPRSAPLTRFGCVGAGRPRICCVGLGLHLAFVVVVVWVSLGAVLWRQVRLQF